MKSMKTVLQILIFISLIATSVIYWKLYRDKREKKLILESTAALSATKDGTEASSVKTVETLADSLEHQAPHEPVVRQELSPIKPILYPKLSPAQEEKYRLSQSKEANFIPAKKKLSEMNVYERIQAGYISDDDRVRMSETRKDLPQLCSALQSAMEDKTFKNKSILQRDAIVRTIVNDTLTDVEFKHELEAMQTKPVEVGIKHMQNFLKAFYDPKQKCKAIEGVINWSENMDFSKR
jgi:hypothetical protein